ncbi:DUF4378 domain protein isoform X2 [Tasmannia lanceolata]|uniref:DUF4378 domain protein isoform X2 n=1 Tax=Tasmannia lanceolata TaxID=3420 RepID=UPI004064B935
MKVFLFTLFYPQVLMAQSDIKTESKLVKPLSLQRRPPMVKDILSDDMNFSPSNDFLSVRMLLDMDIDERKLHRNQSKAPSKTISTFQKASEVVINAIKHLPFTTIKHGILPRSLSQRLRRRFWKKNEEREGEICIKVRVKDIIRLKSFTDEEEKKNSFDFISLSKIWSETDSELDFLQSSCGKKQFLPENNCVGEDSLETAICYGEPKADEDQGVLDTPHDKEQFSPVSVLDFPYEEEEETPSSSFQQSLANMERRKQQLMQKIRCFESLAQLEPVDLEKRIAISENSNEEEDEKPRVLLKLLKTSLGESRKTNLDRLLLDFFREGLQTNVHRREEAKGNECEEELLSEASDWIEGCGEMGKGVEDNSEVRVREMERGGKWRKFGEEEEELAVEMESGVFSSLVEELLIDLLY